MHKECPNCGNPLGDYGYDWDEEWFVCEVCGWGFQLNPRRFGASVLSELREVVGKAGPLEWTAESDELLANLENQLIQNGWSSADALLKLQDILKRPFSERNLDDWEHVKHLSRAHDLLVLKDGKLVRDYVEEPPKLYRVPNSKLRPIEELPKKRIKLLDLLGR
jgi:hypothetical protein